MTEEIRLETIASTKELRELREPEKPKVMDEHKTFVSYQGRYFAVPSNYLDYLMKLSRNVKDSNKLAVKRGLMCIEEDGTFGCGYCNFQINNPIKEAFKGNVAVFNTEGKPRIYVKGCLYDRKDLRYSTEFIGPKGEKVDAWCTPCVVHDSNIEVLITTEQLDEFEVYEQQKFLEIKDLVFKLKSEEK